MRPLRELASRIYDRACDLKLGVNTVGVYPSNAPSLFDDNVECNPTTYRMLERVLKHVPFTPDDVLVDFGCGKGRAICYFAAKFPFQRVVGVEISPHWAERATRNVRQLKRQRATHVEVVQSNAIDFDCSEGTVFYLFNPFGEQTLAAVLANIRESLVRKPRPIKLLYHNPLHRSLFDSAEWLGEPTVVCRDAANRPSLLFYQALPMPNCCA